MKISVLGTGYVGLVTGTCLASIGHEVRCIEKNEPKVQALQRGEIPIFEPGLDELAQKAVATGRLSFSTWDDAALNSCDIIFVAVGTPSTQDGSIDLSQIFEVARDLIAKVSHALVVVKSTVVPGTLSRLIELQKELRPDSTLRFASNPEFLREGHAVEDFMAPERLIFGTTDNASAAKLRKVHAPLIESGSEVIDTTPTGAEMIKYTANCYLATRLSFFQEIADLCEMVGASYSDVARGTGLDPRIGPSFMKVGPGYGGSCFPKDTLALAAFARSRNMHLELIEAAIATNDKRKEALAARVEKALGRSLKGTKVTVLGLAFKADTDDIRESAAMQLAEDLLKLGAMVTAFDPAAMGHAKRALPELLTAPSSAAALAGAEVLVIATEWKEFAGLQAAAVAKTMAGRVIVDLRNMLKAQEFARAGFSVHVIGEKPALPDVQA